MNTVLSRQFNKIRRSILITAFSFFSVAGCGGKSSTQRDSGTCEDTGRVTVPGIPEIGTPSRCVAGATPEQICNLKDMKHNPVTNECVPVAEGDARMLYLHDSWSAVRRLDEPVLSICVGGDAYTSLSGDDKRTLTNSLISATKLWLTPLKDVGLGEFENRISIVESATSCPAGYLAKVIIVSDTTGPCKTSRRGCVYPDTSIMYLRVADGRSDAVIVHEMGHILGLDDLYIDNELRAGDAADYVTGCIKGFFGSTMCHERKELGPADITGIRNIYCAVSETASCPPPKSWANSFFGSDLALCSSDTGTFTMSYDRSLAIAGQVPYGGKLSKDMAAFIDVVGTDTAGSFSELNLAAKDGSSSHKWNLDATTLDGEALTCSTLAPWLAKL